MNAKTLSLLLIVISIKSNANNNSIICTFKGEHKNRNSIEFGTVRKEINSDYDFDIALPKSKNEIWSTLIDSTHLSGSAEYPMKGWIGLAFLSSQKPHHQWACIKLIKGQEIIISQTTGDLTLFALCKIIL